MEPEIDCETAAGTLFYFFVVEGTEEQNKMKVIRWKTMTLLIALMVGGICGLAIVRHIEVEAQDTQSICRQLAVIQLV